MMISRAANMAVSMIALDLTIIAMALGLLLPDLQKQILVPAAVFWAVAPPIWFLIEWTLWRGSDAEREIFKYSQELARNVWFGVGALIALFLDLSK